MITWILDYASPVSIGSPPITAPVGMVRKCLLVIKDIVSETTITEHTTKPTDPSLSAVAKVFDGGLNSCFSIKLSELDLSTISTKYLCYTIVAVGFSLAEIQARDLGDFEGVFFYNDPAIQPIQVKVGTFPFASIETMCYTVGLHLSLDWSGRTYKATSQNITDAITSIGVAESVYEAKGIAWGKDDFVGTRLISGFVGGRSMSADYIEKEISIQLQTINFNLLSLDTLRYTRQDSKIVEQAGESFVSEFYLNTKKIQEFTLTTSLLPTLDGFLTTLEVVASYPIWKLPIIIQPTGV